MSNEQVARILHEVNRAYCASIGDDSQRAWEAAEPWQREVAMTTVQDYQAGKRMTGEQRHEGWKAERIAAGWVYGAVKDGVAKTHPCIVPYAELPQRERTKDDLVNAVLLGAFGP